MLILLGDFGSCLLFKGRMSLASYRDLLFEIPPHASLPRILGTYRK